MNRIIVCGLPAIIGCAIYVYVCCTRNITGVPAGEEMCLPDGLDDLWDNIRNSVLSIYSVFGFRGGAKLLSLDGIRSLISIALCTILVFVVPVLQGKNLQRESGFVKFYFYYSVMHMIIMFTMVILLGYTASRYLLSSIFAFIVLSGRYIYVYWINQEKAAKYVWIMLYITAIVAEGLALIGETEGWKSKLDKVEALSNIIVDKGLKKGYADYWDAYNNVVYSDFDLEIGAVEIRENDIRPYYWLNDGDVYTPNADKSFLLVRRDEAIVKEALLYRKFGSPNDELTYGDYAIYIFDYDIASAIRISLEDNVISANELCNKYGGDTKLIGESVLIENGVMLNSELLPMECGEYILEYEGENVDSLYVNVKNRTHRLKGTVLDFISGDESKRIYRLNIIKDSPLTEYIIGSNDGSDILIHSIKVTSVN